MLTSAWEYPEQSCTWQNAVLKYVMKNFNTIQIHLEVWEEWAKESDYMAMNEKQGKDTLDAELVKGMFDGYAALANIKIRYRWEKGWRNDVGKVNEMGRQSPSA